MAEPSKPQGSILSRLPAMPPRPGSKPRMPAVGREEAAKRRLTQRLEAIHLDPLDVPAVDPRTAAVAALMVANFVGQDAVKKRFAPLVTAKLFDYTTLEDLPVAARFVLRILPKLGPELHERDTSPAAEVVAEAQAKHAEMMRLAERYLSDIDEAHGRLVTIRLGQGDADLVQDLRMLAELWRDYADTLEAEAGGAFRREAEGEARELALHLERSILGAPTAEDEEWRSYLSRALSMLVPLYDETCRAGRFLFHKEKPEARFPTFASVARVRRRLAREVTRKSEARAPASIPQPPSSHPRPAMKSIPPEISLVEVNEVDEEALAFSLVSVTPAPPPAKGTAVASAMPTAPGLGRPPVAPTPILDVVTLDFSPSPGAAEDQDADAGTPEVDLELTYASESNFYADLAQSNVGIFIATFVVKPPGTPIGVRLTLPQLDHPILVSGTVRWVREFSPSIEAPPGMGLALEHLPAEHRRVIEAFMKVRAPILHDDD